MSKIDSPEVLQAIADWQEAKRQKAHWEAREKELRGAIVTFAFPAEDRVEGTNRVALGGQAEGWKLKLVHKIDRKVDEASLAAVAEAARTSETPFTLDTLIVNKPELAVKTYKALTDAQRKVMDHALIIKDASPTLELEGPKEADKPADNIGHNGGPPLDE